MSEYKTLREQENARNRALLQGLELEKVRGAIRGTIDQRPGKRRKITKPVRKSVRTSSRLAAAEIRPSHTFQPERGRNPSPSRRDMPGPTKHPRKPRTDQIREQWASCKPTSDPPTREDSGTFNFASAPDFYPNNLPSEIMHEGVFGGSYFWPLLSVLLRTTITNDWRETPSEWPSDLDIEYQVASPEYNPRINKYGVSCGQINEQWEANGWINHQYDVRGWFRWYCRPS
jgi:hypothetical protein